MYKLNLKIITPKKIVIEKKVDEVSLPTPNGEITVLPRHTNLFSLLKEGIVRIKEEKKEEYLAIGGGYLETDGEDIRVLVSHTYGQDKINETMIKKAEIEARRILSQSKNKAERQQASISLKRSIISSKLIKRRRMR